jgi:hypothetical protein
VDLTVHPEDAPVIAHHAAQSGLTVGVLHTISLKAGDNPLRARLARVRVSGDPAALARVDAPKPRPEVVCETSTVLGHAARAIREDGGYVPRSARNAQGAPATPTVDKVRAALRTGRPAPEPQDLAEAARTQMWVKGLEPSSDYERSVKAAAGGRWASERDFGTAASAVNAYQRDQRRNPGRRRAWGGLPAPAQSAPSPVGAPPEGRIGQRGGWTGVVNPDGTRGRFLNGQQGERYSFAFTVRAATPLGDGALSGEPLVMYVGTDVNGDVAVFRSRPGLREADRIVGNGVLGERTVFNGQRQTRVQRLLWARVGQADWDAYHASGRGVSDADIARLQQMEYSGAR